MITGLSSTPDPEWLFSLKPAPDIQDILTGSLFYPASGIDGAPVKYLGGMVHSFVYADYGVSKGRIQRLMAMPSFLGYRTVRLGEYDLGVWDCSLPESLPEYIRGYVKPFFALMGIFERVDGCSSDHGPKRFSILYLCAEGISVFKQLYVRHAIAPRVIAIIRPGHGFGFNWTNFIQPSSHLRQAIGKGSDLFFNHF